MQSPILAPAALVPHAEPSATFFKSIGYVEKADGQLEAIIMQDDAVQVVRIGDRIADRYKVTSITPEVVGAIEEPAMVAKLEPADMLPHGAPEAAGLRSQRCGSDTASDAGRRGSRSPDH